MSDANKETDDIIYKHFHSPGHQGLADLSIQIIDKVNDKDALIAKEGQWATDCDHWDLMVSMTAISFLARIAGQEII